jgi:hypothetical protein
VTDSSEPRLPVDDSAREVLRHVTATLAYRAAKALRGVPPEFATFSGGATMRQPVQIVAHLADLLEWGVTIARGDIAWKAGGSGDWDTEVHRFFAGLAALDAVLAAGGPFKGSPEKLIQGPLADAFTHVGQIAILRGMAGVPVRPESYARAEIVRGRVGPDQAASRVEFDGDASASPR